MRLISIGIGILALIAVGYITLSTAQYVLCPNTGEQIACTPFDQGLGQGITFSFTMAIALITGTLMAEYVINEYEYYSKERLRQIIREECDKRKE